MDDTKRDEALQKRARELGERLGLPKMWPTNDREARELAEYLQKQIQK